MLLLWQANPEAAGTSPWYHLKYLLYNRCLSDFFFLCQSNCESELLIFSSTTIKQCEDGFKYGRDNQDENIWHMKISLQFNYFRMLQDASGCFRMLQGSIRTIPRGGVSEGVLLRQQGIEVLQLDRVVLPGPRRATEGHGRLVSVHPRSTVTQQTQQLQVYECLSNCCSQIIHDTSYTSQYFIAVV